MLEVIQGSTPRDVRELIRERFTKDPAHEPVRVLLATDAAGEGIDLQDYCYRLINMDIPFNPSRLEQRIGRIDRYGQEQQPQVFHFLPDRSSTVYTSDLRFMEKIARKVATVAQDLGSVNQVISQNIQHHFSRTPQSNKTPTLSRDSAIINKTLAGNMELNKRLTQLERDYQDSKTERHLGSSNLRRVVDTALQISRLPLLKEVGDDRTDAAVFEVPRLVASWHLAMQGLDTRLEPGKYRPITFDDHAARGRDDVVYVHLGHPLVKKAQRLLRRSLWSSDAPLHRITAVVVEGLQESFAASVTRMVLVGRGGIRLHEEIFLAGVRLRGRRIIAEDRAEELLNHALDSQDLPLAAPHIREDLVNRWNSPDSVLRNQLLESMHNRAEKKHRDVEEKLAKRQTEDIRRAKEIFAAFRQNLRDSLDEIARKEDEAQLMLIPEQHQQRRRDIEAMRRRLDELADEESREVAAITNRYQDVKPHVTAAAVVFALTPADAGIDGDS